MALQAHIGLDSKALQGAIERAPVDRSRNARHGYWGWIVLVVISFFAGRFLFGLQHDSPAKLSLGGSVQPANGSGEAKVVTTEPIVERLVQRTVNAVGTMHAFEEIVLSSKMEGRVLQVHCDVSSAVRPGEILLQLDETDSKLSVQQAERSLQAELAKWGFDGVPAEDQDLSQLPSVLSAKVKYELAKSRYERMQQLKTSQAISVDDFEQANSEVRILENEWRNQQLLANSSAATARLRAADLAIAQQRLADCALRVPQPTITDRVGDQEYLVSERMVSEGSLLRPGTEVFRLVLGKTLKLRLSVPEIHSSSVRVGQSVQVFPSSSSDGVEGRVAKVAPSVDRATRTFLVEVEVPNEDGRYKPGGFAKGSILVGQTEHAITVPLPAVHSLAGIQKIFVMEGEIAREHHVTLGEQGPDWVEIVAPKLVPGARVITSGQRMLSDGDTVVVRHMESVDSQPSNSSTLGNKTRISNGTLKEPS
jgi:RND family efflux transporter MFP subunit